VLDPDTIYLAHDRFVCAAVQCCGFTAASSGRTLGGVPLRPIEPGDIAAWPDDLPPIACQCGRLWVLRA